MITKEKKAELIKKYSSHKSDVGSSEVQIAILTERISNLSKHLNFNQKDFSTKKGLISLVNRRKKLLKYLNRKNCESYLNIKKDLGLRG